MGNRTFRVKLQENIGNGTLENTGNQGFCQFFTKNILKLYDTLNPFGYGRSKTWKTLEIRVSFMENTGNRKKYTGNYWRVHCRDKHFNIW